MTAALIGAKEREESGQGPLGPGLALLWWAVALGPVVVLHGIPPQPPVVV